MTFEEYQSKYGTNGERKAETGRISNKKDRSITDWYNLATETGRFVDNQEKARKNALKSTNDAELRRRAGLYPPTKHASSIPNPNIAFVNKKLGKHTSDRLRPRAEKFVVPDRYKAMYDDMVSSGNSVNYTIICIKDYISQEERGNINVPPASAVKKQAVSDRDTPPGFPEDDTKVSTATVVKQAVSDHLDKVYSNTPFTERYYQPTKAPINAPSKKVRTKIWNPKTEEWVDDPTNQV